MPGPGGGGHGGGFHGGNGTGDGYIAGSIISNVDISGGVAYLNRDKMPYTSIEVCGGVWLDGEFIVGLGRQDAFDDMGQYMGADSLYSQKIEAQTYLAFVSFSASLTSGGAVSEATLVIQDSSMEYLEERLINSKKGFHVLYGEVRKNTSTQGEEASYKMRELYLEMIDYSAEMRDGFSTVTIQLCSATIDDRSSDMSMSLGTKYPHEAFIKICELLGWRYVTYPTKALDDDISITGISPNEFLSSVLPSKSESVDGDTDYRFWIVDHSSYQYGEFKKDIIAYYLPSARSAGGDIVAEYQAGSVQSWDLISFTASYKGSQLLSSGTESEIRTMVANTRIPYIYKRSFNTSGVVSGNQFLNREFSVGYIKKIVAGASLSQKDADIKASAVWAIGQRALYNANLQVRGNPDIEIGSSVYVLVMTSLGNPHHSSGKYMVTSLVENLNSDGYTAEVALVKVIDNSVVRVGT